MLGLGLAEGHTPDKMNQLSSAVAILDRQEHAADFEEGYVCRCTGASDSSIWCDMLNHRRLSNRCAFDMDACRMAFDHYDTVSSSSLDVLLFLHDASCSIADIKSRIGRINRGRLMRKNSPRLARCYGELSIQTQTRILTLKRWNTSCKASCWNQTPTLTARSPLMNSSHGAATADMYACVNLCYNLRVTTCQGNPVP